MRYDTFEIKNLGLTPFVITNISMLNNDSPFVVPLQNATLPIKVDTAISLPIMINNNKLTTDQTIYTDAISFQMQDIKSKQIFVYEIIVQLQLSFDIKHNPKGIIPIIIGVNIQ